MILWGVVGASGSGKTTLIVALVTALRRRGLSVSTMKHAHHGFELDTPGKDSWRHQSAGASEVMVVSEAGWSLLHPEASAGRISPRMLATRMAPVDIMLVEGFRDFAIPRLEVFRPALGKSAFFRSQTINAVVSDAEVPEFTGPVLPLNDIDAVANFLLTAP